MTPQERAIVLCGRIAVLGPLNEWVEIRDKIAAEIEAAQKEAFESAAKIADKRGWQFLKDKVVGYAEGMRDGADLIAQEIRRRAAEGERGKG
jgi:hypothetical protein